MLNVRCFFTVSVSSWKTGQMYHFLNKYQKSQYSLSMFIDHVMLRARDAGAPFREVSWTLRSCSGEGLDFGGVHQLSGFKSSTDFNEKIK